MEKNSMFGLEGKKALVLGGGQGTGEMSAMILARAGCDVALVDLETSRAERVAQAISALGRQARVYQADVTDDAALTAAITGADGDMGGLDVMVTVIGMAYFKPVLDMSMDEWDLDQKRNVRYFFLAAKLVAASLIRRGKPGSIVCITSADGLQSAAYHAPYGSAKAGLVNLVRSMSEEWGERGVRVNAIAPGSVRVPRMSNWTPEQERERTLRIPLRRRGTTEEIAKGVLFLASDLASYVTGHTLAVDGGYSVMGPIDYGDTYRRVGGGTIGMPGKPSQDSGAE